MSFTGEPVSASPPASRLARPRGSSFDGPSWAVRWCAVRGSDEAAQVLVRESLQDGLALALVLLVELRATRAHELEQTRLALEKLEIKSKVNDMDLPAERKLRAPRSCVANMKTMPPRARPERII